MKKYYIFSLSLFLFASKLFAQTGEITGRITDADSKEGVSFATVVLLQNGTEKGGAITDFDGYFSIKPIDPGTYDIRGTSIGYNESGQDGIYVQADQIVTVNLTMSSGKDLPVIKIYEKPLIQPGVTAVEKTVGKDEIKKLATTASDINNIVGTQGGVFQRDDGDGINVAGLRDYSNKYYVDGIPMRGSLSLPQGSIEQLTVVTGGIAAKYGDATGGIISITTRGPSKEYHGGFEAVTSEFLDGYGYDLGTFNLSGPIITKYKKTDSSKAVIGFFIAGEFEHNKDGDPSAVGNYRVRQSLMDSLNINPLQPADIGIGFVPSSSFLTLNDLEKIKYKQNIADNNYRFSGKIDFKTSNYTSIVVGGNVTLSGYNEYDRNRQLLNSDYNRHFQDNTFRGFVRFTQRFPYDTDNKKTGTVLQNAYYQVQADYNKFKRTFGDPTLGTDAFAYGYVGSFETYRQPIYVLGQDPTSGLNGWLLAGYQDTSVAFTPGTINPILTAYTTQYYNLSGDNSSNYSSLAAIQAGGGLLNGQTPSNIYSMWYAPGTPVFNYGFRNNDQFRLSVNGSVDIINPTKGDRSKHAIEFGVEFEQRIDRSYTVAPVGLWGLARQLANSHIATLDVNNPLPVYDEFGVFQDTVNYNRLIGPDQAWFDKQLRELVGAGATDYINVDAVDPSLLNLNMFTPDELFNNGGTYVNYFGYDYLGNVITKQPSFDDFFTQKDANGNYTRPMPAFRPTYTAAYIQDVFSFKDLVFNVGLRTDIFDANQKVLKDQYSLYPVRTAGEVSEFGDHPSNVGNDWVVYVDDPTNPTKIVGYRDGDTWYNAQGTVVNDPKVIAQSTATGQIAPYLQAQSTSNLQVGSDGFKDYTPETTLMPRVAFSFPISDEALFFAHYDVLTQRPTESTVRSNPFTYYFLEANSVNGQITNPSLRPEKTIDYQVGFKQALGENSVLTLSGTYRELKDMIQVVKIAYAYPTDYTTYGNKDFGTVKAFEISYDMRRVKNITLSATYRLQFADGTGSNTTSQLNLINSGQPNLRTIIPFGYDQRHQIVTSIDYRFGEGVKNYNGPLVGKNHDKELLANAGLNMILRAGSGTPYTRNVSATPGALFGVATNSSLKGTVNGSRLPWTFKIDLKLDKDFKIGGKDKDGDGKTSNEYYFNAYVLVQNVLNTQNVVGVYAYTGVPGDDGWLASSGGQASTAAQYSSESFVDLYRIKMNNPDNYSQPRRIHFGLSFNF